MRSFADRGACSGWLLSPRKKKGAASPTLNAKLSKKALAAACAQCKRPTEGHASACLMRARARARVAHRAPDACDECLAPISISKASLDELQCIAKAIKADKSTLSNLNHNCLRCRARKASLKATLPSRRVVVLCAACVLAVSRHLDAAAQASSTSGGATDAGEQ